MVEWELGEKGNLLNDICRKSGGDIHPQRLATVYRQGSTELANNIIADTDVSQLVNDREEIQSRQSHSRPCAHNLGATLREILGLGRTKRGSRVTEFIHTGSLDLNACEMSPDWDIP